jgi:hypothetical protein
MRSWIKWLSAVACLALAVVFLFVQNMQAARIGGRAVVPVQYYTYYGYPNYTYYYGYPYYAYAPAPYYYYSPGYYSSRFPGISVYKAPAFVRPRYYPVPWVARGPGVVFGYRWWW